MWGLIVGALALIGAGAVIIAAIALTLFLWSKKVDDKFEDKRAEEVVSADLEKMAQNCPNRMTRDELRKLRNKGYTHTMAKIDSNGKIFGDVELIKDTENDREVAQRHGSEGIVVIER